MNQPASLTMDCLPYYDKLFFNHVRYISKNKKGWLYGKGSSKLYDPNPMIDAPGREK